MTYAFSSELGLSKQNDIFLDIYDSTGQLQAVVSRNLCQEFEMIKRCPVCGEPLEKIDAMHYCMNPYCDARHIEGLIHFVSKDAMDIDGLGEKVVEQLFDEKLITSIPDIYRLHQYRQDLLRLEGFSDKSVDKLLE